MRILVTGANGMLAKTLIPVLQDRGHSLLGPDREQLDVTDYAQVMSVVASFKPDLVIQSAAYTKVDLAESEPDVAFAVNAYGTENVAIACAAVNAQLVYISTDYVFNGRADRPYRTWEPTDPISVYGSSKLAGEQAVKQHMSRFFIIRTSWLYGPGGTNFVDTMIRIAAEHDKINVVYDQKGTPTSTLTLSQTIADLITTGRFGVYHATDAGETTWFDFAREILHSKGTQIVPVESEKFPRPAARPAYSVLDKSALIKTIGRELVPWQQALSQYLNLRLQKQPA